MTPKDSAGIRKAIRDHWKLKTDDQLAASLRTNTDTIRKMRAEMNLKGTESLKQFAQRYLLEMTDPEKKEFMSRLPAELIWRMAEGSPATSGDININTEPIRIDITHQLLKVYGYADSRSAGALPADGERIGLPARTGG